MALPKQVQAQIEAADALLAEAAGTPDTTDLARLAAETDAANESPQAVEPTQSVEQSVQQVQDVQPDPFEARYKVLQGKYNAEVPALHKKVHELEAILKTATERLEQATRDKTAEQQPQAPVTDAKDIENFGSDLVDMVNRVAATAAAAAAKRVEARSAAIEEQMRALIEQVSGTTQHVAMTAEQMFFDKLAKLVPNWETINTDRAFLAWLAETDPVYGVPRQAALENAQKSLNAERAAAVFTAFSGPRPTAPKPDPVAKQVSPKSAGSAEPPAGGKPFIPSAQVTQFYDELRQGKYRGREAEAARIEQVINEALAEGRIK